MIRSKRAKTNRTSKTRGKLQRGVTLNIQETMTSRHLLGHSLTALFNFTWLQIIQHIVPFRKNEKQKGQRTKFNTEQQMYKCHEHRSLVSLSPRPYYYDLN